MRSNSKPLALAAFAVVATTGLAWCVKGLAENTFQLVAGLLLVTVPGVACFAASVRYFLAEKRHQPDTPVDPEAVRHALEDADVAASFGKEECEKLFAAYQAAIGEEAAAGLRKPWEREGGH